MKNLCLFLFVLYVTKVSSLCSFQASGNTSGIMWPNQFKDTLPSGLCYKNYTFTTQCYNVKGGAQVGLEASACNLFPEPTVKIQYVNGKYFHVEVKKALPCTMETFVNVDIICSPNVTGYGDNLPPSYFPGYPAGNDAISPFGPSNHASLVVGPLSDDENDNAPLLRSIPNPFLRSDVPHYIPPPFMAPIPIPAPNSLRSQPFPGFLRSGPPPPSSNNSEQMFVLPGINIQIPLVIYLSPGNFSGKFNHSIQPLNNSKLFSVLKQDVISKISNNN